MKQVGWILLALVFTRSLSAQDVPQAVRKLLEHENLQPATVSLYVADVQTGETVLEYQSNRFVIPASALKLIPTGTALEVLGPDFRYETYLEIDGPISAEGVLDGNVYIRGTGDPSLGAPNWEATPPLEEWLASMRLAIQQAGIRRIRGRIIGDGSRFGTQGLGYDYSWKDIGNYYAGGVYGLNIHENLYFLFFQQQTQLGMRPVVEGIFPSVAGLTFHNELRTAGRNSGDQAYIYGAPYTYQRYLRGTLPAGSGQFSIRGALPDPPLQAAQLLGQALEQVGIITDRPVSTARLNVPAERPRQLLYRHTSPSLQEIVTRTNERSVNLYAEALLRTVGLQLGADTTEVLAGSIEAVLEYWEQRGLETADVQLMDGSGLSARNLITTRFLVDYLRILTAQMGFRASLPIAGESGTLARRFRNTAAQGRIRAKTGSINKVRSLAGYLETNSGRSLAFAIVINNYRGSSRVPQQLMDELLVQLVEAR